MLITYAIDDGDVQLVDLTAGDDPSTDLLTALGDETVLISVHNSNFDRNVLAKALGIVIPIERWRCTMVRAYLHGLPGKLDLLSDIFKLGDKAKHKSGRALVMLFCKPTKDGTRNTRLTHPEKWKEFKEYARYDVVSARELDNVLPKWNLTGNELAYWYLDQRANDRGVAVDIGLAEGALRAVDKAQRALKGRTQELTNYDGEAEGLESTTKRDKMLTYMLEAYGVVLPDLQMATIERRLTDPDLPVELKELLAMRLQASTTSTRKYSSMLRAMNKDGRIRGLIQFAGAFRTARDAGRVVQPQNFPSRGLLPDADIAHGVKLLRNGTADLVYDNVMTLASSCLRAALIAAPGKKLVCADLSNIEGRYLAWIAGEEWKLQAYRDFDAGVGHDLYVLAYARAFGIDPEDVTKEWRQIGKVMELALGFAGGVGAFLTFAAGYSLDLVDLAEAAYDTLPEDVREEAEGFYDWMTKKGMSTHGLERNVFVTCESFKRMWRRAHPMTVKLWLELEDGVRSAIASPEKTFSYRDFKFRRDGQWLRVIMPSGRALCYPYPQLDEKGGISFMGVNQYTRKWERIKTFGGKLAENCIAEGTEVFTDRGWVAIETVTSLDLVWDGVEFVENKGCVFKGNLIVLSVNGVKMTPDHKILTTKGWVDGASSQGYNGIEGGVPDSYPSNRVWESWGGLGTTVLLWNACGYVCERVYQTVKEGYRRFMRMPKASLYRQQKQNPWQDVPSFVLGLALDDRPMPLTDTPSMEKLRGARDFCLRRVEKVRDFLGGYVAYLAKRVDFREDEQYGGVLGTQLPMEITYPSSKQQTGQFNIGNTKRKNDGGSSSRFLRDKKNNVTVPLIPRVVNGESVAACYDLLDCGIRNRFVVRSDTQSLIVHNCTQAGARDVFKLWVSERTTKRFLMPQSRRS